MARYEMPRTPVVAGYSPLVLPCCTQNTIRLRLLVVYGGHPELFGMSAGGVSTKTVRRSMKFHTPPGGNLMRVQNAHPGAPKAP